MKGTTYGGAWDSWYGPSGRSGYSYSWDQVRYGPWNKVWNGPSGRTILEDWYAPWKHSLMILRKNSGSVLGKKFGTDMIADKDLYSYSCNKVRQKP